MKLLIVLLAISLNIYAQILNFGNNFLFFPADSIHFKDKNYIDKHWQSISINTSWDKSGYSNFDGIAWYRYHFSFPISIKDKFVYFVLGKIDDVDETFLNGNFIGKTGEFPPNQESRWGDYRIYKLSREFLQKENVLAIRVCDLGGPGGIYSGPFGIYSEKQIKELFKGIFNNDFKYLITSNGLMCAIINKYNGNIERILPEIYQAYDSSNTVSPLIDNLELIKDYKIKKIYYLKNTNIITAEFKNYRVDYFVPYSIKGRVFAIRISSKKDLSKLSFNFDTIKNNLKVYEISKNKFNKYLVFTYNYQLSLDEINNFANDKIFNDNLRYFISLFNNIRKPEFKSQKEKDLFEQSVTVLKMAQVSDAAENQLSRGQILASLPPGMWNIAWIRDGVYSVFALNNLGLFDEAKKALEFYLNARTNYYKSYIHKDGKDYGIGVDYQISVCRYFGNGSEESDANEDGPNIEIDGFGLFLQAFCDYINKSNDWKLFDKYQNIIETKIIEPIIFSIDKNNLIRKESGAWERHLPGKQFAYTSVSCAKGLFDYAQLIKEKNPEYSNKIIENYEILKKGINTLIVNNDYIRGTFENLNPDEPEHFDALTFEVFNNNILDNKELFNTHYKVYSKNLRINNSRGFARVNSNDWYDRKEWIFINFRIMTALNKYGYKIDANKLLEWIIHNANKNNNLIPELLNETTAKYEGAIPMVGFGAASYINYLFDRNN
ncbi:MAG TPA: hypothetical protein PLI27_08560 [Ignavibacteriales bacterium]|nr:hypothetical protein [Ignavibacteriales bacterium]HOL81199.1 hypothetical protein [Ignavibacteriales bacterium]HOM65302.1 hypothetical protein [Ignavibacteriales bacterium]HPD68110.1 hypothetical protein [Ignavibacteriales bacterium]HPP33445.1 hypothetical protein [Ignavibacteriales bacterium]